MISSNPHPRYSPMAPPMLAVKVVQSIFSTLEITLISVLLNQNPTTTDPFGGSLVLVLHGSKLLEGLKHSCALLTVVTTLAFTTRL